MISEKTDEEKLRQELEGGVSVKKPSGSASKKKNSKSKTNSRQKNLNDTIDTFMEDFERRIGSSLNPETVKTSKNVKAEASISDLEELLTPSPLPQEVPVVPENEVLVEEEVKPVEPEELEIVEPEPEELPDIPILEEETEDLPEIPVILPDEEDEDFGDILSDEPVEPVEKIVEPEEQEEQEEPEVETLPEFQETALVEADEPDEPDEVFADLPEIHDDVDEVDAVDEVEDVVDEQPALDFSPPADVVVNVDDVIPEIPKEEEIPVDPESEAAPVTVTMPESTKTAEDKLMADIAEAMTGNPLSLETNDTQALYNLPENFLPDSPSQSAEDKLKANIAQALSESPITAAQSQSQQDLEQDLSNPFEEISLPTFDEPQEPEEPVEVPEVVEEEEVETEEPEEVEEADEPFDVPVEEEVVEEHEEESEDDSPFEVVEDVDDTVVEPEPEPEPEPESESEPEPEVDNTVVEVDNNDDDPFQLTEEPEPETEHEDSPQDIDGFGDLPFSLGDDEEHEEQPEPEVTEVKEEPVTTTEPMTELEALSQFVNTNLNEEAAKENQMPDESLLDGVEPETETNDDDWDISSLGSALSEATTIPDDEPEHDYSIPETVTEMITQPETEEDHKEKTMGIREKLALRKNAASEEKPTKKKTSSGSGGGFFMPLILTLLLIVGSLILWQLTQMSNKLTSLALNTPAGFESVAITEMPNPSYDYAIDFILDPNLTERMSQRGRDGWQVVGSRRTQDSTTGQYGYEFIFMRRTPGR